MLWLWMSVALGSDLKAGLGACADDDLRGALAPLDAALSDTIKPKWRAEALVCRARGILSLDEAKRGPRVAQAADDLIAAMEAGAKGDEVDAARKSVAGLQLAAVMQAFSPSGSQDQQRAALPLIEQSIALHDTAFARALATSAALPDDLGRAAAHGLAGLTSADLDGTDISVVMICLSPFEALLAAERTDEAAKLLARAEAVLPGADADPELRATAEVNMAKMKLMVQLAEPKLDVKALEAQAATAPADYELLVELGTRLLQHGAETPGAAVMERAEALDPSRVTAPYNLGAHYLLQAAQIGGGVPSSSEQQQQVRALLDKALPALRRAQASAPSDRATLEAILVVCEQVGDTACVAQTIQSLGSP